MLRLISLPLMALMFTALVPAVADEADADAAAGVVVSFNEAVTARDMDTAMALIAEGSVQFHLRPAHPGMPEDHPLTEDMTTMWQTVSAILFPTTDAYERIVEVQAVHADGELATVWTQTRTVTHRKGKAEPMVLDFSEMYFLVNKNDSGWRIAGNASNRPIDSIPVAQSD